MKKRLAQAQPMVIAVGLTLIWGQITIHTGKTIVQAARRHGALSIPFCYREKAANLLIKAALDPYGKIPRFKFWAVAV